MIYMLYMFYMDDQEKDFSRVARRPRFAQECK